MIWLIVLGSLLAYLLIGRALALHCLPLFWKRARENNSDTASDYALRSSVHCRIFWMLVFWPVAYLFMGPGMLTRIDRADPEYVRRLEREIDESHQQRQLTTQAMQDELEFILRRIV